MRLPVHPIKGDEKWELLSKIVDKLETREAKKALARNKITPVNKAIEFLKIIILAMFFELEISYAVSEVNKRLELRKFLRIDDEVKLRSVYNFMSKFESEQFIRFIFSILNVFKENEKETLFANIRLTTCGTLFQQTDVKACS